MDAPDDAPPPTGKVLPIVPCGDTLDAVYVTPTSLPPYTPDARGDIVRCAGDTLLDEATVSQQLKDKSLPDVVVTTGTQLVRIAYRTERAAGVPGVGTARVYLPTNPLPAPLPVIVIAHPSQGLADVCAPSRDPNALRDLALPWAARGYAVIAPDYAGLGNEGTQGYLDNHDTAHSVLDAARALRKMLAKGWLSPKVAIFGHSQGGGAALSAQSLAGSYGCDGQLAAVAVFAPEWPSRLASLGLLQILSQPAALTIGSGITKPVVAESLAYAHSKNGGTVPYDQIAPATKAAGFADAAEAQCLQAYGGYLQGAALHLGDLFDDQERTTLLACATGQPCLPPGKELYDFLVQNIVSGDPAGAPILYVQGLLDTIMPPSEEAACNLQKLAADGVKPQVCTDTTGIHTNVVVNNIVFGMKWAEAVLAGQLPPTCSAAGMPPCSLP
jgi:pimeloyl-ACP methyl ester carboxylesterase